LQYFSLLRELPISHPPPFVHRQQSEADKRHDRKLGIVNLVTGLSSREITACERPEVGRGKWVQGIWSRRSKVVDGRVAAMKKEKGGNWWEDNRK
jgi:hypothetical protein